MYFFLTQPFVPETFILYHFPETDFDALDRTIEQINILKPKEVMIHDWMSYQSINHHDESKMLSKILNMTDETASLEKELESSLLS